MRLLTAYARERLMTPAVIAGVLLVTAGAQLARAGGARLFLIDLLRAAILAAAFRAWDDLADREHDRDRHPARVTVRTVSATPLVVLVWLLWTVAASLTLTLEGFTTFVVFVLFTMALGLFYWRRTSPSALGTHLVLAKYAVFVGALAGFERLLTPRGALIAAVVYLAACVYEWAHDRSSPLGRSGRFVEAALLAGACVGLVLSFGGVR